MSSVITILSSDDENDPEVKHPSKKFKPTHLLDNLPQISYVKVTKKENTENEDIVILGSDEEDVTYVPTENIPTNGDINSKDKTLNLSEKESNKIENSNNKVINGEEKVECMEILDNGVEKDEEETNEPEVDVLINPFSINKDERSNLFLIEKLIKIIDEQISSNTAYEVVKKKLPTLLHIYKENEDKLETSTSFKTLLITNIHKAEISASKAVISFNDIYQDLKDRTSGDYVEVDENTLKILKRLSRKIKKIKAIIKKLEEEEIDFDADDDENSSYIKLDRYGARLVSLHKKYCKLLKKNPYSGRIIHSKLDFVDSEYIEINRAISKKYKNNTLFPSYYEMEEFIKKVAKKHNLELSETKLKSESKHCFEKLGELLQMRRRKDLYDSHYMLIKDSEDPAKLDPSLSEVLDKNYKEGQSKIDNVVKEFVDKQETKGDKEEEVEDTESDTNESEADEEEEDKDNDVDDVCVEDKDENNETVKCVED